MNLKTITKKVMSEEFSDPRVFRLRYNNDLGDFAVAWWDPKAGEYTGVFLPVRASVKSRCMPSGTDTSKPDTGTDEGES